MKKVAIPISGDKLSEQFGGCNFYEIFDIEGRSIFRKRYEIPNGTDIKILPEWLKNQGVTDVIAYKVSPEIIKLFASKKVNLFVGVEAKSSDQLIDDYLKGQLESNRNIISEITKERIKD